VRSNSARITAKATDERLREEKKATDEKKANEPGRCMSGPGSL